MDSTGVLCWPVVFVYPEFEETDLISSFNENHRISDHLYAMFEDESPPWDVERKYRLPNLEVYFEDSTGEKLCFVKSNRCLKDILSDSRLATVLLYLNEPEKGGETAFPLADNETFSTEAWEKGEGWKCNLAQNCHKSNLVIKPEKGKAIMWYNHFLDKNTGWLGELDQLAQHGGCDVLEGTKWVANLWLTLVGEPGRDDAFKGWIDYGKDETKYKLGTNWKGEVLKAGEETKETQENQEGAATKTDEETREEKEKTLKEAKERGDGSYDVKLEL